MKKNTLYTANKYNKDAFARYLEGDKNLFYYGGTEPTPQEVLADLYSNTKYIPNVGMYGNRATGYFYRNPEPLNLGIQTVSTITQPVSEYAKSVLQKTPPKSVDVNTSSSKTPFWQSKWGQAAGVAASLIPDEWYDKLDPLYHLANGKESKVGNALGTMGKGVFKASAASGNAKGMLVGAGLKVGGDVWNILGGTKAKDSAINAQEEFINQANLAGRAIATANTTDDFRNKYKLIASNPGFNSWKDFYSDGLLTDRGKKKGKKLVGRGLAADASQTKGIDIALNNINKSQGANAYLNSAAYGGPLFGMGNIDPSTAIGYDLMMKSLTENNSTKSQDSLRSPLAGVSLNSLAKGGKIKIKHPGRLTELKKRTGKTEAQLWAEGKPEVRKMITFARNARKWKKAYGGYLDATNNLFAEGGLLNEDNIYALGGESFPSDMTLDEAYEKARERGQEYFYFNGKRYSTGLTADTKKYAEGGIMDSELSAPISSMREQSSNEPELIYEAGQDFPSGIWRFPDGTYRAANAKGEKVTLSEEQVAAYIEMDKKRKAQERQQFAEGGLMEGISEQMPQEQIPQQNMTRERPINNQVSPEDISQEQEDVSREEESQEMEEESQEELPELGEVLNVTPEEAKRLKAMGYEFKVIR